MKPRRNGARLGPGQPALPQLKHKLVQLAEAEAEPARRRAPWRPLALAGAGVLAAVAAVLILFGAGGVGGDSGRADAADLAELAPLFPHVQVGGGWQITTAEILPGGGRIEYHSEEESRAAFPMKQAEIRWSSASIRARGRELESEGFEPAGRKWSQFLRPAALFEGDSAQIFEQLWVRVYVAPDKAGEGMRAVGLWRDGKRTIELHAVVPSIRLLEDLLTRIWLISDREWLIALRPGGGKWLSDIGSGTVRRVEKVRVGETPSGGPIYEESALLGVGNRGEEPDLSAPLPTIYREGDRIRVLTQEAPEGVE